MEQHRYVPLFDEQEKWGNRMLTVIEPPPNKPSLRFPRAWRMPKNLCGRSEPCCWEVWTLPKMDGAGSLLFQGWVSTGEQELEHISEMSGITQYTRPCCSGRMATEGMQSWGRWQMAWFDKWLGSTNGLIQPMAAKGKVLPHMWVLSFASPGGE